MAQGRKTGGRLKGTPNKTTARLRDAIEQAFEAAGGIDYLTRLARDEPRLFLPLLARLLPTSLTGAEEPDDRDPIDVIRIELVSPAATSDALDLALSEHPYPRAA